jgi:hypothetical protein
VPKAWELGADDVVLHHQNLTPNDAMTNRPSATATAQDIQEFQQRFTAGMQALEAITQREGPSFRSEVRDAISELHSSLWNCAWLTRSATIRTHLASAISDLQGHRQRQDVKDGSYMDVDVAALTGEDHTDVVTLRASQDELQTCWFLGRYVNLMERIVFPDSVPNRTARRYARDRFASASKSFLGAARLLRKDQYLLAVMKPDAVTQLDTLIDEVDALSKHLAVVLKQPSPVDPFPKGSASETGDRRELILDLADCCFRTFRACTADVLRTLLEAHDLGDHYRRDDTLDGLLTLALDRKVANAVYREQLTYEISRTHITSPWKAGVWIPHLAD